MVPELERAYFYLLQQQKFCTDVVGSLNSEAIDVRWRMNRKLRPSIP